MSGFGTLSRVLAWPVTVLSGVASRGAPMAAIRDAFTFGAAGGSGCRYSPAVLGCHAAAAGKGSPPAALDDAHARPADPPASIIVNIMV